MEEVNCPDCGEPIFVRHQEGGILERGGLHRAASVFWQAECHNDKCGYQSGKRNTAFALIQLLDKEEEDFKSELSSGR